MKSKEIIKPLRKHCDCGKIVVNHHWLCDECWYQKRGLKLKARWEEERKRCGTERIFNPQIIR